MRARLKAAESRAQTAFLVLAKRIKEALFLTVFQGAARSQAFYSCFLNFPKNHACFLIAVFLTSGSVLYICKNLYRSRSDKVQSRFRRTQIAHVKKSTLKSFHPCQDEIRKRRNQRVSTDESYNRGCKTALEACVTVEKKRQLECPTLVVLQFRSSNQENKVLADEHMLASTREDLLSADVSLGFCPHVVYMNT